MSDRKIKTIEYVLIPPDGGWGYAVTFGLAIMMTSTIVPISSFALIFGNYLSTFTDKTYATAIVTSLFGTLLHITGLLSHFVLKKFSYRQVGIIGSLLYFIGSLGSVFVTKLHHIILFYSVFQGVGVGLIMPSGLSAVNSYFDSKRAAMNGAAQAFLAAINITFPVFTRILLDEYGFRGTQAIFAAFSLHALLGSFLLQPVQVHMKKVETLKLIDSYDEVSNTSTGEVCYRPSNQGYDDQLMYKVVDLKQTKAESFDKKKLSEPLTSAANFGSMVISITAKKSVNKNCLFSICDILDMNLLKDIFYLNMAFGLAICTMSEMNFMAILPLYLFDNGFSKGEVTVVMTVYFASDLLMRILFVFIAAIFRFNCRKVFFWNAIVSFILRLVFSADYSFWWITCTTAFLGFSRCLIQSPMPVVIAEKYSEKFSSALSFYMVVTGVTSIALGAIMGYVRTKTQNMQMVFHVLTISFLFCIIPWMVEMIYKHIKRRKMEKDPDIY